MGVSLSAISRFAKSGGARLRGYALPSRVGSPRGPHETHQSSDDDIPTQIQTINEDLARTRPELSLLLGVVIFVILTTLSIADIDLLIGRRISLPILDVTADLHFFLLSAPALVLAIHMTLLLRFRILRAKLNGLRDRICSKEGDDDKARAALGRQLNSHFFAEMHGRIQTDRVTRWLSVAIYCACLIVTPFFAMLAITVRSLPLHEVPLTTWQNLLLALDLFFMIYLHATTIRWRRIAWMATPIFGAISLLIFSVPDSPADYIGIYLWSAQVSMPSGSRTRWAFAPTAAILEGDGSGVIHLSRNLVVVGDQDRSASNDRTKAINLAGRDLRYSVMEALNLQNANLVSTDLEGSNLNLSDLRQARFGCTGQFTAGRHWNDIPRPAYISAIIAHCTILEYANMAFADLSGSTWFSAFAPAPPLENVNLLFAKLDKVELSGANFNNSDLTGASLVNSDFRQCSFIASNLTGANLSLSDFTSSFFFLADLQGALLYRSAFYNTDMIAARFDDATIVQSNFQDSYLAAATFNHSVISDSVSPPPSSFAWADLSNLQTLSRIEMRKRAMAYSHLAPILDEGTKPQFFSVSRPANFWGDDQNSSWLALKHALTRSNEDVSYRSAVSEIIANRACLDSSLLIGLFSWIFADADRQPLLDYTERIIDPGIQGVDPKLTVQRRGVTANNSAPTQADASTARPPLEFQDGPMMRTVQSPLPEWFPVPLILDKIDRDRCAVMPRELGAVLTNVRSLANTPRNRTIGYEHSWAQRNAVYGD